MMLDTIPAELGRVIPQHLVRCSQCGRQTMETVAPDPEPLCSVCRINDRFVEMGIAQAAVAAAYRESMARAREHVHEIVIPIERDLDRPPRFGIRRGEIESCDLIQSMRHNEEVDRDATLCRRLTLAFCLFEGLLLIAAAAAMGSL